jgi:5-methylcytosine-specific restriction protein A
MTLTGGNRAIAQHAVDGKELLLFEALGAGRVRFRGPFNCAGFSYEPGLDRSGAERRAIVFHLIPAEAGTDESDVSAPSEPGVTTAQTSLRDLRRRALAASGPAREVTASAARSSYFIRSQTIRLYVLGRAQGKCESCDARAPFVTKRGEPYLEPHHIRRLTDQGTDDPRYMAALCPNCHREVHYGVRGDALNRSLQARISEKELTIPA